MPSPGALEIRQARHEEVERIASAVRVLEVPRGVWPGENRTTRQTLDDPDDQERRRMGDAAAGPGWPTALLGGEVLDPSAHPGKGLVDRVRRGRGSQLLEGGCVAGPGSDQEVSSAGVRS